MKYVFFVTTVGSIYNAVLPLIEEKKNKGEILIVVATDEAEKFFSEFTDFNFIRIKVNPNLITKKNKYKIFANILRSKIEFRKLFKDIEGAEVYFCGYRFSIVIFSYVKKLLKKNKVFNCSGLPDERFDKYPVEHGFRAFIMRWIAKWFMGVETVVSDDKGVPVWMLDECFFKDITVLKDYGDKSKIISEYLPKLEILKGKTILIMMVDLLESGGNYAEPESFIKAMDDLMVILNDEFSDSYLIKPHPRENRLYGKMLECEEIIPSYIPAEFILHHPWRFVIGIISTSLVYAAEHTDSTVISIMDLFKWNDAANREIKIYREEMKKVNILIPKDINEFKGLLLEEKSR